MPTPNATFVRPPNRSCSAWIFAMSSASLNSSVFVFGSMPCFSYQAIACSPNWNGSPESCRSPCQDFACFVVSESKKYLLPNVSVSAMLTLLP